MRGVATGFGRLAFRYRDYLAPGLLLVLVVTTRPVPFLGRRGFDVVLDCIGIAIALTGQAIRMTVIGLAYIKRGGRNKTITADRLVCEGVFAHCRNPMYVGNILLITGLLVVWNSPIAYLVVLPLAVGAFVSIVEAEEAFLRGRFGREFEAYCKRVPRFIPRLRGFRETLAGFDFDWRRVIRKEYGTTTTWTSVVLLLLATETIRWRGIAASRTELAGLGVVWVMILLGWATARWAKKTHRLDSPD